MVHNENNRAFVVSNKGVSRMDFHYQWEHEEAPRRGLRNPWAHRPDKPIRYEKVVHKMGGTDFEIKGTQPIYNDYTENEMIAWRVERDEYMRQRDEWIALQMFNEYGYDTFLAESIKLSEDFRKSVFPCESQRDPQCNMFCPIFNDCAIRTSIQDWKEMK